MGEAGIRVTYAQKDYQFALVPVLLHGGERRVKAQFIGKGNNLVFGIPRLARWSRKEGWLGRTIKAIDPNSENVLTGVNLGRGLPRALAMEGVPVASVGDLSEYGLLTDFELEKDRNEPLDLFDRICTRRRSAKAW